MCSQTQDHIDLFSGIGGFALAWRWCGGVTTQFVELDPFCQKVLQKNFPGVPIHDDIKTFKWELDKNDVKRYKESCEIKNNNQQTSPTLDLQSSQKNQIELFGNVNTAEKQSQCPQVSQKEDGDFVRGNVEEKLCEGIRVQTQGAVSGCKAKATPCGKTGGDTNGTSDTIKKKSHDGEEGSLQEITTPAKNADMLQTKKTLSMLTTKNHGKTIQKKDLMLITESLSVRNATERNTPNEITLLTAGVPCQPASCAGKRQGTSDDRWLWGEAFRVIAEVKPKWCILENVRGLLSLEGGVVFENLLLELEAIGYETRTFCLPACAKNAPHRRDRVWIVAHDESRQRLPGHKTEPLGYGGEARKIGSGGDRDAPDTAGGSNRPERRICEGSQYSEPSRVPMWNEPWLEAATRLCRVDARVSGRVDRLKSLGNAIVPQIAYEIIKAIKEIEEATTNQ